MQRTRETLNDKIRQLNSAIDNISSRLRGNKKVPAAAPPLESDPEFEGVWSTCFQLDTLVNNTSKIGYVIWQFER